MFMKLFVVKWIISLAFGVIRNIRRIAFGVFTVIVIAFIQLLVKNDMDISKTLKEVFLIFPIITGWVRTFWSYVGKIFDKIFDFILA